MSERSQPVLSDELYLRFRDLLQTHCGLFYPEQKRDTLAHGLDLALRASELGSLAALYAEALQFGPAWETILQTLTIGETYFFRNAPQFEALRGQILPELIGRDAPGHRRGLRIWSAGCATGEEPYSIAMALTELLAADELQRVNILGTDINTNFLRLAAQALYGTWSFRDTSETLRTRYFSAEGNRWQLNPEIRQLVRFGRLNLVEPSYPSFANATMALDLILCRNVTIYFDETTTRQIVDRFFDALVPGGWLIVGHAEPQARTYARFETHNFPGTVVYRKPQNATRFPNAPIPASGAADLGAKRLMATPERSPRLIVPPAPVLPVFPKSARGDVPPAPTTIAVLLHEGRTYADAGEWSAAEDRCALAIKRDPLCLEAHYLMGQVHEHQGQLDAALASYRRTVYLDPDCILGLLGMANVWRQMGRFVDAQRGYRKLERKLAKVPGTTLVPLTDGATIDDMMAIVAQQLTAMA